MIMVTITKKIKVSLTAIAFVLGIGAAFATNFSSNNSGELLECGELGTESCIDEVTPNRCCIINPDGSQTDPANFRYSED